MNEGLSRLAVFIRWVGVITTVALVLVLLLHFGQDDLLAASVFLAFAFLPALIGCGLAWLTNGFNKKAYPRTTARTKTKLEIVATPDNASIFLPTNAPAFTGADGEDLLCGSCNVTLCQGVSVDSFRRRFAAPVQLLIKCPKCASHNRLPDQAGN